MAGPVLALGRVVGGDRAVHAEEPARPRAQGRPDDPVGHPACSHLGLPLARLPGGLRSAHHGVQSFQSLVPARLLASDAGRAGQGWTDRDAVAIDSTYVKGHRSAHGGKGGPRLRRSAPRAGVRPPRSTPSSMCSAAPASSCWRRVMPATYARPRRCWPRRTAASAARAPIRATTPTGCASACGTRASHLSSPASAVANGRSATTSAAIASGRVEATLCRLKDFRRTATRYDKLARNYAPALALAAIIAFWC